MAATKLVDYIIKVPPGVPIPTACTCPLEEYDALIKANCGPTIANPENGPLPCPCDACPELILLKAISEWIMNSSGDTESQRWMAGDLSQVWRAMENHIEDLRVISRDCPVNGDKTLNRWMKSIDKIGWEDMPDDAKRLMLQWSDEWTCYRYESPIPQPTGHEIQCQCWHHDPRIDVGQDPNSDFLAPTYATPRNAVPGWIDVESALERIKKTIREPCEEWDAKMKQLQEEQPFKYLLANAPAGRDLGAAIESWTEDVGVAMPLTDEDVAKLWEEDLAIPNSDDRDAISSISDDPFPDYISGKSGAFHTSDSRSGGTAEKADDLEAMLAGMSCADPTWAEGNKTSTDTDVPNHSTNAEFQGEMLRGARVPEVLTTNSNDPGRNLPPACALLGYDWEAHARRDCSCPPGGDATNASGPTGREI